MKKKIIMLILVGIFLVGCGEMIPYQRQVWGEAVSNMAQIQHEQNLAKWQYSQPQIVYPRQQNNSTYWQEQYYRDKVLDSP